MYDDPNESNNSAWAVGGGAILGPGVGFFLYICRHCILPDLGFGLIVASLIPEIKQDANEILHLWMIYFRVRDLDSMVS